MYCDLDVYEHVVVFLQLVDIFGSLLQRPLIKEEFDQNYPEVVRMMDVEILACKDIYDRAMQARKSTGKMQLHKNMAKVSGSLRWAGELRARLDANMEAFKRIEHACMESKEAKDVFDHHARLTELLQE